MRFPNHILLDINKSNTAKYKNFWVVKYQNTLGSDLYTNKTIKLILKNSILKKKSSTVKFRLFKTSFIKLNTNYDIISKSKNTRGLSLLWTLFDINFLKKEKVYTKLKYSRSPQYDIVSGGLAALFSAFLGFLISEKFGIELVDSGDFYTFFMYCVFLVFSLRPLVKLLSKEGSLWSVFSFKYFVNYIYTVLVLSLKFLKKNSYIYIYIKIKSLFKY